MRLARADLFPVLTIMAGGVIGASLSFGLLGSRSDDVPVADPVVRTEVNGAVTGRVLDASTGQPIVAVQVFISSLDMGGLTYQNGRYLIQNVPVGTHTLSVSRIGYRNREVPITVGDGQTLEQDFSIAEEARQLNGITVTAERTPGWFVEAMEELLASDSFQPVEVRVIRGR